MQTIPLSEAALALFRRHIELHGNILFAITDPIAAGKHRPVPQPTLPSPGSIVGLRRCYERVFNRLGRSRARHYPRSTLADRPRKSDHAVCG